MVKLLKWVNDVDTLIENGDFKLTQTGLPVSIAGRQELLQRARICLNVPRGSFLHNKNFGSRYYLLKENKDNANDILAFNMAQQALENIPQVEVVSAKITYDKEENIHGVKIKLCIENIGEEVIVYL